MNFSRNKIFNLKVCRIKPFISGFGPNPIEHRAKTGRLHCLLQSFSCVRGGSVFFGGWGVRVGGGVGVGGEGGPMTGLELIM